MDQNQRELRRIANQAFMESLDQLEKTLKQPAPESSSASPKDSSAEAAADSAPETPTPQITFALEALEAAAADIEQSLQL